MTPALDPQPSLRVFSDPASVAVVGASSNPANWGYWLASGALDGIERRAVHLVNRSAEEVLGRPSAPDLTALPAAPELVALCVPAPQVASVVEQGLEMGVRGFIGITAAIPDEPGLANRIRSGGARLLGANSLGLYDASTDLRLAWGQFSPGAVAIITQSGQLGSELAILCDRNGIGVSRFVSVGNQSDVTGTELLMDLATHRSTKIVALYLESFAGGVELFDVLRRLKAIGKPTLLLTVGGSAASARLARSHTGSLTSPTTMVDAACRAAGVLRVRTPTELVDVARGFLTVRTPSGRRVAIAGDSGGQCGIAADVAIAGGLQVPPLAAATASKLADSLASGAGHDNPVDLAGAGEADLTSYATVIGAILSDPVIDGAILTGYFGRYATDNPRLTDRELVIAGRIGASARATAKTVVVHTMAPASEVSSALWAHGVPAVGSIEEAVRMVRGLCVLDAEPPARARARPVVTAPVLPGYWAARTLIEAVGVPTPRARVVRTTGQVRRAASTLTAPYVLKAGWVEHKSDVGAVVLALTDEVALVRAFAQLRARLGEGEYVVEEQDTCLGSVEVIVGAQRDPALGPVVIVGAGGTAAEVWQDVAIECAPVSERMAAAMIARLRCAPLLAGWRGRPGVDVGALVEVLTAVSHLISTRPDIAEIDLNPVRVSPRGALAVDTLVVSSHDEHRAEPGSSANLTSRFEEAAP